MSSWADSKTASQFVSLTLKLKDKLHPPRVRRSERIKHTLTQRDTPAETHKSGCVFSEQQRVVVSSLQYFKALVDRLGVDRLGVDGPSRDKLVLDQSVVGRLLGGASGGVLEAVQTLVQLDPDLHDSKTVSACLTRLYRSLAQLIRWADQVMLQGVSHSDEESTESVTAMIRAVLDGVKELVRLAVERRVDSTPLSPVQPHPAVGLSEGSDHQETSDRTSTCRSPAEDEEDGMRTDMRGEELTVLAPPKPPIPFLEPVPFVTPLQGLSPPALPPKKRHSGPAPCRIAIVTPMRRELKEDGDVQQQDDCWKRRSSDSAVRLCEDDPDYDFLHADLSSSETLPPLPPSSSLPPTLPEKRRRSTAGMTSSWTPPSFEFDSAPLDQSPAPCSDDTCPDGPISSPLSPSKTPPPLPEKKRHIHQYLQYCSSYSVQSAVLFSQRPPAFRLRDSSRQREVDATYQLSHTHLDAHLDPDATPSPERPPAPTLPPKTKQHVKDSADKQTEESQSEDSCHSVQQEVEPPQRSSEEEEEVLLTNQQEILHRLTMKSEEEEGPDVKAASPEILLVHATETSSIDQDLYCEAFLCTYRSFISPNNIISKLQLRYRHLCDQREPTVPTAAKNTFHLLVRVVEELCTTELDSDLLQLLIDLVSSLLIGGELGPAHQLHSNILSKMEKRWQLIDSPQSLRPLAAKGVAARPGTLLDFRSHDLAEQLTLLDSELFYKIQLPEVLQWSKEQSEERCPNLTEFTQHFNNVSFWVRSVIILQDKHQDRERMLLKFLKVMKHLRKLNNFNSYLAILSALDSAPLRRLDWQRHTSEALEEFGSLIDSSSSFRAYRAALADVEPPCIPYLGLILQDLTFVHLGNPGTLVTSQGSKVNFSKCWQQFHILGTLRSYQHIHYSLQPDDDIISFFNDFSDHLAEEALWELSLRIRPKNAPRANQR